MAATMSLFGCEVRHQGAETLFNNPPVNALAEAMPGDFLDALVRVQVSAWWLVCRQRDDQPSSAPTPALPQRGRESRPA